MTMWGRRGERRGESMELRHLETLLAIAEEGSFTAAADALATVQSNVSDQVRQLETELGVPLLVRSRRGAQPTEFGLLVLDRARRVERELEALRADIALVQGLDAGYARLGVVGTASRWLVPALVADLRDRAPGVRRRVNEGASERLLGELVDGELAQAIVTEPVNDRRLAVEPLLEEDLIGLVSRDVDLPRQPVPLAAFAQLPLVLPPEPNPLRVDPARDRDSSRAGERANGSHRGPAAPSARDGQCARRADVARRPRGARQRAQPRREAHAVPDEASEAGTVGTEATLSKGSPWRSPSTTTVARSTSSSSCSGCSPRSSCCSRCSTRTRSGSTSSPTPGRHR